jgi:hypothetical protein
MSKIVSIEKIIYAKRKSIGFTNNQLNGILNLEIHSYLLKNPGHKFISVNKPVKNSDSSHTFTINFETA